MLSLHIGCLLLTDDSSFDSSLPVCVPMSDICLNLDVRHSCVSHTMSTDVIPTGLPDWCTSRKCV